MEFLSQNTHISPDRLRPDSLFGQAHPDEAHGPATAVVRFEWPLRNGALDFGQLPVFREFLDQFGPP